MYQQFLTLVLLLSTLFVQAQNPFITVWETTTPNEVVEINRTTLGTFLYDIDWGDGTNQTNLSSSVSHVYANPGVYEVKISGIFSGLRMGGVANATRLREVKQWGDGNFTQMSQAFKDAVNMNITATDLPNFSGSFSETFRNCRALVGNNSIGNWDMSNVTSLGFIFYDCKLFNININNWNVSNIASFGQAFNGCTSFNQPLNNWDVSSGDIFVSMFQDAINFNQPLNNWNMSKAFNVVSMFKNARAFNQDIGGWNTSNVLAFWSMFEGASSFNHDISKWDFSKSQLFLNMLDSCAMSKENYDKLLLSMAEQNVKPNMTFGAAAMNYCQATDRRQNILIDSLNWTIVGDNQDCSAETLPGDVAVPAVWLKADQDSLLGLADNTEIGLWKDISGFQHHATAVVGKTPTYRNNAIDNFNFNPIVQFDGAQNGDIMQGGDLIQVNSGTMFAVALEQTQDLAGVANERSLFSTAGDWSLQGQGYEIGLHKNPSVNFVHPSSSPSNEVNITAYTNRPVLYDLEADALSLVGNRNGQSIFTGTFGTGATFDTVYTIGGNKNTSFPERRYKGSVAEAIFFESDLTDTEKLQVQSYLAVKYGLSLDQTVPTNYLATNGSAVWDATASASHNKNIFGIARDDKTGLNQRVSKSAAVDAVLTIALEQDFTTLNTNRTTAHTNDLQYLLLSTDGASVAEQTAETGGVYTSRIGREWRVSKTANFTQPTSLKFDGFDSYWSLVGSLDADFSTEVFYLGTLDENGEIADIQLQDGIYITLAKGQGPGSVFGGLALWFLANKDINVTSTDVLDWTDLGPGAVTVTSGASKPQLVTNAINFNPAVQFAGAQTMAGTSSILATGKSAKEVFVVASSMNAEGAAFYMGDNIALSSRNLAYNLGPSQITNNFSGAGFERHAYTTTSMAVMGQYVADSAATTLEHNKFINGKSTALDAATVGAFEPDVTGDDLLLGGIYLTDGSIDNFFDGEIAEIIFYNQALTDLERKKVSSYLAIKYGLTLDQTIPTDYINSRGDTIWKASNAANFNENIFGIGVDEIAGLHQAKSKSVSPTAILTLEAHASLEEDGFVVVSCSGIPDLEVAHRIGRTWQVQNTNFEQTVDLEFAGFGKEYQVVYASNPDFEDKTILGQLDADGSIKNIQMQNGYLTLQKSNADKQPFIQLFSSNK